MESFCGGAVLFQFGYSAAILLLEVIISDLTSLQSRLLFSYIPAAPFLINCFVSPVPPCHHLASTSADRRLHLQLSANVVDAITANTTWQVGIGLWAAVYPFCALLVIVPFVVASRKAKRAGLLDDYSSPYKKLGFKGLCRHLFWEIDVVGVILVRLSPSPASSPTSPSVGLEPASPRQFRLGVNSPPSSFPTRLLDL